MICSPLCHWPRADPGRHCGPPPSQYLFFILCISSATDEGDTQTFAEFAFQPTLFSKPMISIYLFIIIIQYINNNTIRIVVLASVTGWTRALPLSRLPNIFFSLSLPSVKAVRGVNEELQKDHCLEAHEHICAQINSAQRGSPGAPSLG